MKLQLGSARIVHPVRTGFLVRRKSVYPCPPRREHPLSDRNECGMINHITSHSIPRSLDRVHNAVNDLARLRRRN